MLSKVYFTILISIFIPSTFSQPQVFELVRDYAYPQWLKNGNYRTNQTSGITYANSSAGKKTFLLVDDIGAFHKLTLIDDCIFNFSPVHFSEEVKIFLGNFPRLDFEEIVFDRYDEKFYLSIEGNGSSYADFVGIYELGFNSNLDTLISMKKIDFEPLELFLKYTALNIGYEGLTVDSRYFYLGLEGFVENRVFADSTIIFIADKKSKKILKEISTKSLNVHSVTGLYSDKDHSIWLLDRNNLQIINVLFNEELDVSASSVFNFEPVIPGYKHLNYVGSYESITIDDEENLYIVDDPWREFFIPPDNILEQLDDKTKNNFKEYTPVIDRFQIIKQRR